MNPFIFIVFKFLGFFWKKGLTFPPPLPQEFCVIKNMGNFLSKLNSDTGFELICILQTQNAFNKIYFCLINF